MGMSILNVRFGGRKFAISKPVAVALFGITTLLWMSAVSAEVLLTATDEGIVITQNGDGWAMSTPADGLWTIGTGWSKHAPQAWHHASPIHTQTLGPWTHFTGTVQTPDGPWRVSDQYRVDDNGLVHAKRRWQYLGDAPSGPVVLSVRYRVSPRGDDSLKPFLPGIQYYGNPSGTRIDPTRVPTWQSEPGFSALYQEHRYPMPFAAAIDSGRGVAALHSRPSKLPAAARDDLWWSLGLIQREDGVELTLQSGPVATNGQPGMAKARQTKLFPFDDAHMVAVEPGTVIEKQFWIQLADAPVVGHEFQKPLWTSIDLFDPVADRSMPAIEDVMSAKLRDTFDRWHQDAQCRGFRTRPPQAQSWMMMGWADRAEVPGHALLTLDLAGQCDDPVLWKRRAAESLDFLCQSPTVGKKADPMFAIVYDYQQHRWLQRTNPLSTAQALTGIARAIRSVRDQHSGDGEPAVDVSKWETFLAAQLDLIRDRVGRADWHPVSTNEAFAIAPLVLGSELMQREDWMDSARRLADHTIDRHLTMAEPYWGGTLDARCEDKEGAWAALQGFAALYESTGDKKYLDAAVHAADVCLSYLYVWDVDLPPGRLADQAVKTRGWTDVSVQNQHLDVFGVVFTPVIWQLGDWTGDSRYHQLAQVMLVSCGQMTDLATGVQGEQLFQTNYQQHDAGETIAGMRGGYSEAWNIYWITAHFLTAAAEFQRLGVDWRSFPVCTDD
ncbi:hypothetical protein Mal65_08090 [Crateriforma conspicua]|nr:hypothetical protein Mal65_08090 [Crateriforma conspicua]